MTIYRSLLTRGYFPKELPPAFFTELFARYAATKAGRSTIASYRAADSFTECVKYKLALPGLERRELKIPHPYSFAGLAELAAKNLSRLLKKAGSSPFSRSRPIYATGRQRAIHTMIRQSSLARERAAMRGASTFLLKADVSQFYPSLYTHAVGWAVDPKLRKRANWNNKKLLGKRVDQALMDLDGKVSQGIPIGNDISFLLAEAVLAQVDKAVRHSPDRAYRWFDDYELAFDTFDQAEHALKRLNKELAKFRLRLNAKKTSILRLPRPSQDEWQEKLKQVGNGRFKTPAQIVKYFDTAFRLRDEFPDTAVLLYAIGLLFKVKCPSADVGRIAQSCITQTLLCEPGSAQKAFALLSYWKLNGMSVNADLITETVNQMVVRHQASGLSSDIAWALAYCLQEGFPLAPKAARVLSNFDDDCIALQALDMHRRLLLPKGFSTNKISKVLKDFDLDREHWLIVYESVRHGFLAVCKKAVSSNSFFSSLLKHDVTFYRTTLPKYAAVIHPGGAPSWLLQQWMKWLSEPPQEKAALIPAEMEELAVFNLIKADLAQVHAEGTTEDMIVGLLDRFLPTAEIPTDDLYPA